MGNEAKLTFIGDIMCEPLMLKAAKNKTGYDFRFVFKHVKEMFDQSDAVIGNLETPLAGKKAGYTNGLFSFNTPDDFVDAIIDSGISLVTTANNHCLDRGMYGLKRTIKVLDKKGLAHTGTWFTADDRKEAYYMQLNGNRVAIVTSTYGTNFGSNHRTIPNDEECLINLLHHYKEPVYKNSNKKSLPRRIISKPLRLFKTEHIVSVKKLLGMTYNNPREDTFLDKNTAEPYFSTLTNDIKEAKSKSDIVIFYPHVGGQFNPSPGAFTKYSIQKGIDAGADIVIASHPHIVQKSSLTDGIPVFYSIGNFSMSPNSVYLLHDNKPEYGIAVHLYLSEGIISRITFSILKMVETKNSPLTVYPVDVLYSSTQDRSGLEEDVKWIYHTVTGKSLNAPVIRNEYSIFDDKST